MTNVGSIMKKFYLGIILTIGFSYIATAQSFERDSIHFSGAVYDAEELSGISEVHILGNGFHSISELDGSFSMWVQTGDTIRFSHVAYKNTSWAVSDTIKNPDMLVGIFLSKDTVAVSEIVIYPRLRSLESLMTQPLPQDKDIRNAKNNLSLLGYQARNTQKTTWDAEDNANYALQKSQMQVEYAGLISPDEMVSFTAIIPIAVALIRKKYADKNKEELKITSQEEDLLKTKFIKKKLEE